MSLKSLAPEELIHLHNVSWPRFQKLLAEWGDDYPGGRLAFDHGELEIVTVTKRHETMKKLIGRLIETLTEELEIDIESVSSATLQKADLKKAVEADECYYVQHEAAVWDKEEIDLSRDPPPDLVVEVDIAARCVPRMPIYASIGIPEVWRWWKRGLTLYRLQEDGKYQPASQSAVFPMLPVETLAKFLAQKGKASETRIVRTFRAWVRKHLKKRR